MLIRKYQVCLSDCVHLVSILLQIRLLFIYRWLRFLQDQHYIHNVATSFFV